MARHDYAESVDALRARIEIVGEARPAVTRVPQYEDPGRGPSIFRMNVADVTLDDLTLPGLCVLRWTLTGVSFKRTDLHLAAMRRPNGLARLP